MGLDISIDITDLSTESTQTSLTYALDLDNGCINGMIDGIDAVNQFIRKALNTPRFKCLIYDNQYGSEIKDRILDGEVTREYIESELPRLVQDTITNDDRILDVYDFEFDFETLKDAVILNFKVDTVYGSTEITEAI